MCIATVYVGTDSQMEEIMKDVISIESENDDILLTDILGELKLLQAKIKNIDFVKHSVMLTHTKETISRS